MEMTQEGAETSHELNSKITRHVKAYENAVAELRQNVHTINTLGADVPNLLLVCAGLLSFRLVPLLLSFAT